MISLDILKTLHEEMPGITHHFGGSLLEATIVCLEEQDHMSGVRLTVQGKFNNVIGLSWSDINDDQLRACWNDYQVTTEHGAYGIAILLIKSLTDLIVVERSRKGSGCDFWLGTKDDDGFMFQKRKKLEISGLRKGNDSQIKLRTNQKISQVEQYNGLLPWYVVVVEFSRPLSQMEKK